MNPRPYRPASPRPLLGRNRGRCPRPCSPSAGLTLVDSTVTSNIGGGLCVTRYCPLFVSDNNDFGVGATDNDSYDVWLNYTDLYYEHGAGASFTCEGTGECY